MGLYTLSYKNLRRNWWRNINTILRIAFGVIIFLVLVGSGIGITTVLGVEQGDNALVSDQANNKSQVLISTLGTINNTINTFLGPELSNSPVAEGFRTIIRNLVSLVDILASIIFLVGVFGINYAMDMNLTEREREIGLLKSLGFNINQIMKTLILEAGFLGFLGAIIGTALVLVGVFILSGLLKIELFSVAMPLWLPVLAITLTTLFSSLLPLYSIWFHSHKDPVEALRI
ncbi:MAG: FtsX-like permease family protein [Methanobacterium sp.]|nr:FtsX-like permease family protein [Methanobacterium sp.]